MTPTDKERIEKEVNSILELYFPDDYYEIQRSKTVPLISKFITAELSAALKREEELGAEIKRLKQANERLQKNKH